MRELYSYVSQYWPPKKRSIKKSHEEEEEEEHPEDTHEPVANGSPESATAQDEEPTPEDDSQDTDLLDGESTPPPTIPSDHDEYLAWTLGGDLLSPLKQATPLPSTSIEDLDPTSPQEIEQRLAWLEYLGPSSCKIDCC